MCHVVLLLPILALPVFWIWPLSVAGPLYGLAVAVALAVYRLAMQAMRMPRLNGADAMVGRTGRVVQVSARGVTLQLNGEYWGADADGAEFHVGDDAFVTGIDRLRLKVARPGDVATGSGGICRA